MRQSWKSWIFIFVILNLAAVCYGLTAWNVGAYEMIITVAWFAGGAFAVCIALSQDELYRAAAFTIGAPAFATAFTLGLLAWGKRPEYLGAEVFTEIGPNVLGAFAFGFFFCGAIVGLWVVFIREPQSTPKPQNQNVTHRPIKPGLVQQH